MKLRDDDGRSGRIEKSGTTAVSTAVAVPGAASSRRFLGIRVGDRGLAVNILMALLISFISFLLITFWAVIGIMLINSTGHKIDYADSYKFISIPAACVILVFTLVSFGSLSFRRKIPSR